MNEFVYNYIFEISKDKAFINALQFRHYLVKRFGIKDKDIGTNLYRKVINYQIKKYGRSINPVYVVYTKETEEKRRLQINARKQARKNRKGFWLNKMEEKK